MKSVMKTIVAVALAVPMIAFAAYEHTPGPMVMPKDCIKGTTKYCSKVTSDILNAEGDRKVIRVDFLAQVDQKTYQNKYENLLAKFFKFEDWPLYVEASEDIKQVEFKFSDLDQPEEINGKLAHIHNTEYTISVFIITLPVVEKALYEEVATEPGMLTSWKFASYPGFTGSKGFKYKRGWMNIQAAKVKGKDVFNLFLTIDIEPEINIFGIGESEIQETIVDVFSGMFK